jgi:hypothetical protein
MGTKVVYRTGRQREAAPPDHVPQGKAQVVEPLATQGNFRCRRQLCRRHGAMLRMSLGRGLACRLPGRLDGIGESEEVEGGERHREKSFAMAETVLEFISRDFWKGVHCPTSDI